MEKIFAIGDIHGCMHLLDEMLKRIPVDRNNDTLVFIGDFIDRGPDSREVVDCVLELQKKYKTVCLRGNHEEMFLAYHLYKSNRELYMSNGGGSTVVSYGLVDGPRGKRIDLPDDHLKFYESLLPYYETDRFIFVHAGLRPGLALREQAPVDLTWIRFEFIHSRYDFGKRVVFGHTPFADPWVDETKIGIDTGAVYGGKLTCVELPDEKYYGVPA